MLEDVNVSIAAGVVTHEINVSDTITSTTESVGVEHALSLAAIASDTVNSSESVSVAHALDLALSVSDTITSTTESVGLDVTRRIAVSDGVGTSESVDVLTR